MHAFKDWPALRDDALILDTETTGLSELAEIVELSIINGRGAVVFNRLIKPINLIPADVTAIHGITNDAVASAPTWPEVYTRIRHMLHKKNVIIWNADFDMRLLDQTSRFYDLSPVSAWDFSPICAKTQYEVWRAIPNDKPEKRPGLYKWISLEDAAKHHGVPLPAVRHRALADCRLTLDVIEAVSPLMIAKQTQTQPPGETA